MSAQPHTPARTLLRELLGGALYGVLYVGLAAVFVLLLCPLGWLLRALGVDLLGLRPAPQASSYWRPGPDAPPPTTPQPPTTEPAP